MAREIFGSCSCTHCVSGITPKSNHNQRENAETTAMLPLFHHHARQPVGVWEARGEKVIHKTNIRAREKGGGSRRIKTTMNGVEENGPNIKRNETTPPMHTKLTTAFSWPAMMANAKGAPEGEGK